MIEEKEQIMSLIQTVKKDVTNLYSWLELADYLLNQGYLKDGWKVLYFAQLLAPSVPWISKISEELSVYTTTRHLSPNILELLNINKVRNALIWLRTKQNHYQPFDPGTVWEKDRNITIDSDFLNDSIYALTPNVIRLPNELYRMYYTSCSLKHRQQGIQGYIVSAISEDGQQWIQEEGIRVNVHSSDAEKWVYCPDVIILPNGHYRMYFQAKSVYDHDMILSAISEDGLHWTRESGKRFYNETAHLGSPRCLLLEDGRYRLYCHEFPLPFQTGLKAGNNIISAISKDGINFLRESGIRITQETELETFAVYAPEVIRLEDGTYRMYYAGWSKEPREGRIFGATSQDGLHWTKEKAICVNNGGAYQEIKVSEPCITRLPDGRFRMFYEASDIHGQWRILSATTP